MSGRKLSPLRHTFLTGQSLNDIISKPPTAVPGNFNFSGANTDNVVCCGTAAFAPPSYEGPLLAVAVWCYMAGHTAAVNTRGAIWAGNGAVVANSDVISVPQGSGVGGGQFWTRFPFLAPAVASPGSLYFPGWFRQANQDHEWSVFGVGHFAFENLASFGAIGTLTPDTGSGFAVGAAGIYVEFQVLPLHPGDQSW